MADLKSIFSPILSCVPFLNHTDGNRAGMASNFLKQSLVLLNPEISYLSTPYIKRLTDQSSFCIRAKKDGYLLFSDKHIVIWSEGENLRSFKLPNSLWQVTPQKILKKGDIIVSHSAVINDRYSAGRNLNVLFAPYKGWNYEDAIVVTESGAKKLTSRSVQEYEIIVDPDQVVTFFPTLDQHFESGAILFSSIDAPQNPVNVLSLGAQKTSYRTHRAGIVEKIITFYSDDTVLNLHKSNTAFIDWVKEHSLKKEVKRLKSFLYKIDKQYASYVPQHFPESYELVNNNKSIIIRIYIQEIKNFEVGDKLANRYGNKGVCSSIIPDNAVRHPDGFVPDIILNPLGVISRMNIGQIIEMHLGALVSTVKQRALQMNSPEEATNLLNGLRKDLSAENEQVDIDNLTYELPLYETFTPERVINLLKKYDVSPTKVYEFTPGYPAEYGYGNAYWFPLVHTVDAKLNYRADGPYQTKTLQPTSSDDIPAGQRLGEMEIWALFSYGVYNNIKEVLGYKADDIFAKEAMLTHTLKSGLFPVEPDNIYSNHLLKLYLHSIGLTLDQDDVKTEDQLKDIKLDSINLVIEGNEDE